MAKLTNLFGTDPWSADVVKNYLRNMHNVRTFMPPVPGTEEELDALTAYLLDLQQNPQPLPGAQVEGVCLPPPVDDRQAAGNVVDSTVALTNP